MEYEIQRARRSRRTQGEKEIKASEDTKKNQGLNVTGWLSVQVYRSLIMKTYSIIFNVKCTKDRQPSQNTWQAPNPHEPSLAQVSLRQKLIKQVYSILWWYCTFFFFRWINWNPDGVPKDRVGVQANQNSWENRAERREMEAREMSTPGQKMFKWECGMRKKNDRQKKKVWCTDRHMVDKM